MFLSSDVHRLYLLILLGCAPIILPAQVRKPIDSRSPSTACAAKGGRIEATSKPGAFADPNIDALFYGLDLSIEPTAGMLRGVVQMEARLISGPQDRLLLDLASPMTVDSVYLDGDANPFIRYPEGLEIPFAAPREQGSYLTTRVLYHGTPRTTGFGSFIFGAHSGTPWVWSLSQPYGARDWWPCKDHPNDKADSVDIRVRCPSAFLVGANGTLTGVEDHGDGTSSWSWSERYPISTYLVSIAITNYASFTNWYRYSATDSMEILNYVLPEHLVEALNTLPRTVRMLEIFSGRFGEYPFIKEKYGHAEFGSGGAMEHQTMTSTTTFNENTIAHELAHQWFGDMITCASWQDLWLNEGFATYAEALYREAEYGPSDYAAFMATTLTTALRAEGTLFVQDTSSVRNLFAYERVYAKGASVLHMLRGVLGDSLFFRALRAYASDERLRYGTARTADFESDCELATGFDLEDFFREWVFGEHYPVYQLSWIAETAQHGYDTRVTILQTTGTTNPPFFAMPVELRIVGTEQDTSVKVQHEFSGQEFTVHTPFKPQSVLIDPDGWILKDVREGSSELPQRVGLSQNYPNPFNTGTDIRFELPGRSRVVLEVIDILGQRVVTLADGILEAGTHTASWDGRGTSGYPLASGIYICRLQTSSSVISRSMLLLR